PVVRSRDELVGFCRAQREWLLYIDMSAVLETGLRDWEMTRGRGRHVDHVRRRVLQEIGEVVVASGYRKPVAELLCHQQLSIARGDNLTSRDPLDLRRMCVGNPAASDDRASKHPDPADGSFRSTDGAPLPSSPADSRRDGSLPSHWCNSCGPS